MKLGKILSFIQGLSHPRSSNEDIRRQEFILNILLLSSIALLFVAVCISTGYVLFGDPVVNQNDTLSTLVVMAIFALFCGLYALSRKGFVRLVSYFLVGVLFALASYMGLRWGPDVMIGLLFYVITIVMSGILISTRFAFITTILVSISIAVTVHLQRAGIVQANRYWTTEQWNVSDVIFVSVLFLIIATVSWLSNREIEKSLARARKSEAELKHERDMLEVRVIERTEELRKAEVEKMTQAYRFVEFGRLASGLFHDLMNPLSALSLNIENIANSGKDTTKIEVLAEDVARAKQTTVHMQALMDSMRKHLAREGTLEHFSLNGAIHDLIRVLEPYARAHKVTLGFDPSDEIGYHGDAVHFTQVLTNLVSNAIESYPPHKKTDTGSRAVLVELSRNKEGIEIRVSDQGAGISKENQEKVFEPFFTTKSHAQGLGIGLSLAKRIVEKEFKGTLSLKSSSGEGTTFVLHFPA